MDSIWKTFVRFLLTSVRRRSTLQALSAHLPNICRDSKTLFQTPITCPSVPLRSGTYMYMGLENAVSHEVLM